MAVRLKSVKKLTLANKNQLEVSVSKTGGPVTTSVEVASSGPDDSRFTDSQLTPGPATRQLNSAESYVLVWVGAFVKAGSATLKAAVTAGNGTATPVKPITVKGKKGDVFMRVVMLP